MNGLVNWDGRRFIGGAPAHLNTPEKVSAAAVDKRPQEIKDLIAALDKYWEAVGVHTICKACFTKGRLLYNKKQRSAPEFLDGLHRGCCGVCMHLGDKGCIGKPLGCAVYYCHEAGSKRLYARIRRVTNFIFKELYGNYGDGPQQVLPYRVYADGFRAEQDVALDAYGKKQFQKAIRYVKAATKRLK